MSTVTVIFRNEARQILAQVSLESLGGSVPAKGELLHLEMPKPFEPPPSWYVVMLVERTIVLEPAWLLAKTRIDIQLGAVRAEEHS